MLSFFPAPADGGGKAIRKFKTTQNLQEFLLSSQRNAVQRAPGKVEGGGAGRVRRPRETYPVSPSRLLWPLPGSIMPASPEAPLWARRGRIDFAEPGVGLGREGPELSHTVGLIQPSAHNSNQTGNSQDATWNSLQGEEEQREGTCTLLFLHHLPSSFQLLMLLPVGLVGSPPTPL